MASREHSKKTVLIQCGEFNRVVSFEPSDECTEREAFIAEVRCAFCERIATGDRLTLQTKHDERGGASSCIEDKTLIVEKPEVSLSMHTWFKSFAAARISRSLDSPGEREYMSEAYKRHVIEKSVIYRKREGELKEYEKWVNSAATDLCLRDVSLLDKRGKLLQLARKKVANDGYVFKKGHSLSKVYGISQHESTPKQPKYSQEMREEGIK